MKTITFLLISIIVNGFTITSANETNVIKHLQKQAEQLGLAKDPYWLALGHYKKHTLISGYTSEIQSKSFFLAPDGKTNPFSELNATIREMFAGIPSDQNAHAQCRFIARFNWLKTRLNWKGIKFQKANCSLFNEWTDNLKVRSISLIYANGFMGNPASFYGHILLKFNYKDSKINQALDKSINFGAVVSKNENPFIYAFKGVFGFYKGVFSYGNFYHNILFYGEVELRDLWEYELNLNQKQVKELLFHIWELIGREFDYYFFKGNCALRMSELVELVIKKPLISKYGLWSMPISAFHNLSKTELQNKPLVKQIIHHPSRQERFHQKFLILNQKQKTVVYKIVDNNFQIGLLDNYGLTEKEKIEIIDMLFDYIEFLNLKETTDELKIVKKKLLLKRLSLGESEQKEIEEKKYPHLNTFPSMLQLGLFNNSHQKGGRLRFRANYYDMLSIESGRSPYSTLSALDIVLNYTENRLRLKQFEFVNIETLNLSKTGLPKDGGFAWKVRSGIEAQFIGCYSCSIFHVTGGIGKAKLVKSSIVAFIMLESRLQTNYKKSGNITSDLRNGIIIDIAEWWRTSIEIGYRYFPGSKIYSDVWYKWNNRIGNSQYWDIRIGYEKYINEELQFSLSLYW
ncbi:MAG: DUF4105 domain-containing protein [Leptospiraceae bacterium]|nr:DUF4105 domain-containing protein [Leptospiraceae bacterium]MCP5496668.1 DUF4105 domain-containing protein [Leptospiraceae bacterium]